MNILPREIHEKILSKMDIEDLFLMMMINRYFQHLVYKIPAVQNWMNPNIMAASASGAIESNKIIFCVAPYQWNENKNYDYIILDYPEPFTLKTNTESNNINYSRVK